MDNKQKKETLVDITIANIGLSPHIMIDEVGDICIENEEHIFSITKEDIINKGIVFHYEDEDGYDRFENYKLINTK